MTRKKLTVGLAGVLAAAIALAAGGCSTTYDRRDPTGEMFPSVVGTSLEGETVRLPEDFQGAPVVLLVGYKQNTQFDLDRWLLGMHQAQLDVAVREVPTIPGLVPGLIGGTIDSGMRKGIPSEDWGSVVTLYGDAKPVAKLTGTENGLPGRVLLLDGEGRVVFFHDRGYSVGTLNRLAEQLAALQD